MLLDLHIHQNRHSADSRLDILDAIKDAKALNLDGICITDHDSLGLKPFAKELSKSEGLLVIVGVEIYTLDGDILCYGVNDLPKKRLSAQETIDYVHAQGGVCIAAHPYRKNNRGLGEKIFTLEGLDAIEVYNGRTLDRNNAMAYETAQLLKIPSVGGSDAHSIGEIGNYCTYFEDTIESEIDFINAIKSSVYKPVTLKNRTLNDVIA